MWHPGESNLDPNGPDFVSRTGFENLVPNRDELQPKQDEFMASIEHELIATSASGSPAIHSIARNDFRPQNTYRPRELYNIPITNPRPGSGRIAQHGRRPGIDITYYEYPRAVQGAQFHESQLVNFPLDSTFTSVDLAVTRRMAGNWMMQASFSGTWKDNQNVAVLPEDNPNADFNQSDNDPRVDLEDLGHLPVPVWHSGVGAVRGAERRAVGAHGAVLGRRHHPDPGRERGADRHAVLPDGPPPRRPCSRRHSRSSRNHQLAVRFNVYNLLNSNMTLTANTRSGTTFGRPLTILASRLGEISASYKF